MTLTLSPSLPPSFVSSLPPLLQMVDEFMDAVRNRFPRALIQYEDFSSDVAYGILNAYRRSSLVFNDDIQGTGGFLETEKGIQMGSK